MTDHEVSAKEYILSKYPDAFVCYNSDLGIHKVYADRVSYVALSSGVTGESAAWEDAARLEKERKK